MARTNLIRAEAGRTLPPVRAVRYLSLHISERKLLLALVDVLVINIALFLTLVLRERLDSSWQAFWGRISWFAILSGVWLVCAFTLECYNLSRAANFRYFSGRISSSVLVTSSIYLFIPLVTPELPTSRLAFIAFPVLGLMGLTVWRTFYASVLVQPGFHQRALIIGAGWAARTLAETIEAMNRGNGVAYHSIGYDIIGYVDDDVAKQGALIAGARVLGTGRELVQLVHQLAPNELILGITHPETIHSELFSAILECREMGVSITTMATMHERLTGRVPLEHAGRALNVALPLSQRATHRSYLVLKRIFDFGIALIGCLILVLMIPIVSLANRFTAPGPLLYHQVRVGKGGQTILVTKFRSMVVDAEEHTGAVWATQHDPRVTPVGRFLRKTRLDEVPQFWNILKGDMSLIGPRPERPHFVDQLVQQIPFYRVRHAVKPGLTGWAQVLFPYGASVDDALSKLEYDLYYIKNQSILLDISILLKTIPIVLGFKGW